MFPGAISHKHPSRAPGLVDPGIFSAHYDGYVLADAPLAFWKLNETSGSVCADATGNGHDGAWVGSPTLGGAGQLDTCVQLNGSTQFATVGNIQQFPTTGAFSVECLMKPSSATSDGIFSYGVFGTTRNSLRIYAVDATHLGEFWWSDDYSQVVSSYTGAWHHFVALYNGSKRQIYLDGVQQGADNTPGGAPNFALSNCLIGRCNGSAESFTGLLQRLAIYNYALSAAQITAHKTASGL